MTSPPTQLSPLPFRLFSYCHLRTWCLKSCCWSLEHPNGYIWYSCTLMNTHCSYRLIDRERYLCMLLIHLLLYIYTKTYLVLVVVQSLSHVWLFVTPWTGMFALPELWDSPPWPGLWSHSVCTGKGLAGSPRLTLFSLCPELPWIHDLDLSSLHIFLLSGSWPQSVLTQTLKNLCSTPGSSVLHYLLEFAQIHIRWVDDAI